MLVALGSCKKDDSSSGNNNKIQSKQLVSIIFQQALFYDSGKKLSPTGNEPFSIDINETLQNPEGGSVTLQGKYSGNIVIDDNTQQLISMNTDMNFTESFAAWAFAYENQNYTMSANPGLLIHGHSEFNYATMTFGNFNETVKGTLLVNGPDNYSQTNTFDLTITINAQGNGGVVTGTVDGEAVNYSVP